MIGCGARKQSDELLSEKKTLSMEYVALRSNYMNLNSEFDESKEEQQHLNVQLINLINANKALEETATRLTADNDILRTKNDDLMQRAEATEIKYRDYEQERMRLKAVNDKQAIESVKYEVEVARMKTALDATKSEYQKKWLKLSKEKDLELQNVSMFLLNLKDVFQHRKCTKIVVF